MEMMQVPETLVLADQRWLSMRHLSPMWFLMFILGAPLLVFAGVLVLLAPEATLEGALTKLSQFDWSGINWGEVLAMTSVALVHLIYSRWAERKERLTLSSEGIRYTSPLPASLKQLRPDWFLRWSEINRIELSAPKGHLTNANFVTMTFATPTAKRSIRPMLWVDPATYSRQASRFSFSLSSTTSSGDGIAKEVMASEIVRYIADHVPHLVIDSKLGKATNVSLEEDPHGRLAIAIIFILVLYSFVDALAGPESYIDAPSTLLHIYIVAGTVGAGMVWMWLRRSSLPAVERIGLTLLIGAVVGVAMVPGALRINEMTAPEGGNTFDYLVTQNTDRVMLRPIREGLPVIDYFARHAYWDRYGNGELYPVQVHKGLLGFWQFNSSVIIDDMRRH